MHGGRQRFFVSWPVDWKNAISLIGYFFKFTKADLYSLDEVELKFFIDRINWLDKKKGILNGH